MKVYRMVLRNPRNITQVNHSGLNPDYNIKKHEFYNFVKCPLLHQLSHFPFKIITITDQNLEVYWRDM